MTSRGIYLIGFSGTGKSTIAKAVAKQRNWPAFDLDELIVERSGMTIPVIFQREGEPGFRLREAEALREVSASGKFVVATGGGAAVPAENRRLMASRGWIISLEGRPETLLARIQQQLQQDDPAAIRPMLDAVYPLDKIRALKYTRQTVYSLADWTVHTDRLTPDQVAAEVIRATELLEASAEPPLAVDAPTTPWRHSLDPDSPPPIVVAAGPWPYQAVVGWNHLPSLGDQVRRVIPRARQVAVLTDGATWERLGATVNGSLAAAGIEVQVREVEADERLKTLGEAQCIYDWFLDVKLRRDDAILILGGGIIDDIGGFVASTYMRGLPLIKVPTSLEGIVDTSIGGKTALNHPRARNLVGTFFHPRLALSDLSLLKAAPAREVRSAWAEVVKYAMLEQSLMPGEAIKETLFSTLEHEAPDLLALERSALLRVVPRCVALKALVVSADERDLGQYRILLNYGHTVGHALETVTDYAVSHGEAVALGMGVEARLAVRQNIASPEVEARQDELLTKFGLPTRLPDVPHGRLMELIHRDKKVFGDEPRFILPTAIGRAVVSSKIRDVELAEALRERS